jgi:xylose isomerase
MHEEGKLAAAVAERYSGWQTEAAQKMLAGKQTLEQIAADAEAKQLWPSPRSGRQEQLENLVSRYL